MHIGIYINIISFEKSVFHENKITGKICQILLSCCREIQIWFLTVNQNARERGTYIQSSAVFQKK